MGGYAVLLFVSSFFVSGSAMPIGELDPSWQAVLEFARHEQLRFGTDIIFTYGPLGFLFQSYGFSEYSGVRIIFSLLFSVLTALAVLALASGISGVPKVIFLVWALIFPTFQTGTEVAFVCLIVMLGTFTLIQEDRKSLWITYAILLVFSALALIKFSFFIPILAVMLICVADRFIKAEITGGLHLALAFIISLILIWLISGQPVSGVLRYLNASREIAAGYSEAMSIKPPASVLAAAISAAVLLIIAVATACVAARYNRTEILASIALATVTFTMWKQGFVRADGHVLAFLYFAPVAFALVFHSTIGGMLLPATRTILTACYFAVLILCLFATHEMFPQLPLTQILDWPGRISGNMTTLLGALAHADKQASPRPFSTNELRPEDRIPRIAAITGNDPVDVMNYRQAVALLNGLHYKPRPVIQSYSVYTPRLQEINLNFYQRDTRPPYVLFRLETIDDRLPALDDALLLPYILDNYVPIAAENNFLLLKHGPKNRPEQKWELLSTQDLKLGEKLDLSRWNSDALVLRVRMRPTALSRLLGVFYQPPMYKIAAEVEAVGKREFRFIPEMASQGFLVSPLMEQNADVIDLMLGENEKKVRSVSIVPVGHSRADLAAPVTMEIYRSKSFLKQLKPNDQFRRLARRLSYPMFSDPPIYVKSVLSPAAAQFHGSEALMVHAPGQLAFLVPKGAAQISGNFGILDGAYTGNGSTDGVEFAVRIENVAGESREGFRKLLQPKERPGDRGQMAFSVALRPDDKKIFLETTVGPRMDAAYDWSVWSNVKFAVRAGPPHAEDPGSAHHDGAHDLRVDR